MRNKVPQNNSFSTVVKRYKVLTAANAVVLAPRSCRILSGSNGSGFGEGELKVSASRFQVLGLVRPQVVVDLREHPCVLPCRTGRGSALNCNCLV